MTREPLIPISYIGGTYYLFHAPSIADVRSTHRVPGLLTGTLPQASQQNVFFGLPLQLLPEEARLLVEKGLAFIVNDTQYHQKMIAHLEDENSFQNYYKTRWKTALHGVGVGMAEELGLKREAEKSRAIEQMNDKARSKKQSRSQDRKLRTADRAQTLAESEREGKEPSQSFGPTTSVDDEQDSILAHQGFFLATSNERQAVNFTGTKPTFSVKSEVEPHSLTPTTSHPPLRPSSPGGIASHNELPSAPKSYPVFKHLHKQGYFLSPGLRFGCQYMAYPGDPLRFHSHFMVLGRGWEEEVDLLSLVGVGRLGTGVKKGVLVGGVEPSEAVGRDSESASESLEQENVRCFCIEWGGM